MSLPELDPAKRDEALAKARVARQMRAELKQMLKAGEVGLGEVLDRAQAVEALAKMKVIDLVSSMPAYGKVKARRLMERLGIAETRRLRGLGSKQREELVEHFARRAEQEQGR